jgi:hypothetical protein
LYGGDTHTSSGNFDIPNLDWNNGRGSGISEDSIYDVRAVEKVGIISQPFYPAECHPPDISRISVDL